MGLPLTIVVLVRRSMITRRTTWMLPSLRCRRRRKSHGRRTWRRLSARTGLPALTGLAIEELNVPQSLSGLIRRNLMREKISSTLFCLLNCL